MENPITHDQIRDTLAVYYRELYDKRFRLLDEAKAAIHDGDDEAHKAITRRADKQSDFMDGVKAAVELLGIGSAEFMAAVNADRIKEAPEAMAVVTATGLSVFTGSMAECSRYMANALRCGSKPGFLRIIPETDVENGVTDA